MPSKQRTLSLIGKTFTTKYGENYEVIDANLSDDITIKYLETDNIEKTYSVNIRNKNPPNRLRATVCGRGYHGVGNNLCVDQDGVKTLAYVKWHAMLSRCYGKPVSDGSKKATACYKDAEVVDEWYNFQNFADWFNDEIKKISCDDVICLDKDILSCSKIYSKDTCLLLPYKINISIQLGGKKEFELAQVYYCNRKNKYCAGVTRDGKMTRRSFQHQQDAIDYYFKEKSAYIIELVRMYEGKLPKQTTDAVINYAVNLLSKEKRKQLLANIV